MRLICMTILSWLDLMVKGKIYSNLFLASQYYADLVTLGTIMKISLAITLKEKHNFLRITEGY